MHGQNKTLYKCTELIEKGKYHLNIDIIVLQNFDNPTRVNLSLLFINS